MDSNMQLFSVGKGNAKYICWANGREDAKRKADIHWLGDGRYIDPDTYVVQPITNPGDRVMLGIVLYV